MNSIKVSVGFSEREKIKKFIKDYEDEETFICQTHIAGMLIVTEGCLRQPYMRIKLQEIFDEPEIEYLR